MPHGPVDMALQALGRQRRIVAQVSGFATALALARASELIASVPGRHTGQLRDGMHSFALPFAAPTFTVSLMWHPRMEGDAAHRWLRGCVRAVCAASL
jgi:DNA-binding transcriptional LysR family regulator